MTADIKLIERASELLEPLCGDKDEILIKFELWCLLNEEFCEGIEDVDSHDKGEVLREILELVQRHFVNRALAYHQAQHEPIYTLDKLAGGC